MFVYYSLSKRLWRNIVNPLATSRISGEKLVKQTIFLWHVILCWWLTMICILKMMFREAIFTILSPVFSSLILLGSWCSCRIVQCALELTETDASCHKYILIANGATKLFILFYIWLAEDVQDLKGFHFECVFSMLLPF